MIQVIYTGWDTLRVAPELGVEMDSTNKFYGWLLAKVGDNWVTVADLSPIAASLLKPTERPQ